MSTPFRLLCQSACLLAAMSFSQAARADDAEELEKGTNSFEAGRYEEGATRLHELLDPVRAEPLKDPRLIEKARAFYAACLIALGRYPEAQSEIELIYRQNPVYVPDPVLFPGRVLDMFAEQRRRFQSEIEKAERSRFEQERAARSRKDAVRAEQQAYIANLVRLAGEETVVVRRSRWLALVPFGVGQFQNGQDDLGYLFLISEALAAGVSITSGAITMSLYADALSQSSKGVQPGETNLQSRLDSAKTASVSSTIAFAALAAIGIAHAELTFVPESREVRQRPVPKPPAIVPNVSVEGSSPMLGITGHF